MKDIQNQIDHRRINIKKVGVKTITYPITVRDKSQHQQKTLATVNMYVNLPHQFKGTHMSRFVEILNRFHGRIDIKGFRQILDEMKSRLDAEAAHVEMAFPFFLHSENGSGALQVKQYDCAMHCSLEEEDDLRFYIEVPIFSSPAWNQKDQDCLRTGMLDKVVISVGFMKFMWLEDLIDVVEEGIRESSGVQVIEDVEPMESLLNNLAERFSQLEELKWYSLTVESSTHGCSLFTSMSSPNDREMMHQ